MRLFCVFLIVINDQLTIFDRFNLSKMTYYDAINDFTNKTPKAKLCFKE